MVSRFLGEAKNTLSQFGSNTWIFDDVEPDKSASCCRAQRTGCR